MLISFVCISAVATKLLPGKLGLYQENLRWHCYIPWREISAGKTGESLRGSLNLPVI